MGSPPSNSILLVTTVLLTLVAYHAQAVAAATKNGECKITEQVSPKIFDVTEHGAIGDGKPHVEDSEDAPTCLNSMAFIQTWQAACHHEGPEPVKVLIPKMKFVTGPVGFLGPCTNPDITVEIQGTVSQNHDPAMFVNPEWFWIHSVNGLKMTGSGVIDAEVDGKSKTPLDCKMDPVCVTQASGTFVFSNSTNVVVEKLTLLNSAYYQIYIHRSSKVTVQEVTLIGPSDSPNTDGIRIQNSDLVTVKDSVMHTGDDCVSLDAGCSKISITGVVCGPGNGISIEPLGKETDKKGVKDVIVQNCTFKETNTGVGIRTVVADRKTPIQATGIMFKDLIMEKVMYPIVIDQEFNPNKTKLVGSSQVKIKGVHFECIKGTTISKAPQVSFICSETNPCEDITVQNVQLTTTTAEKTSATCSNAKVTFTGQNDGLACPSA